ncbi:MAG TPA: polysaccharide biosynthesis/export family protein [Gemmataceae bacterium]|nr:polysaccharide biosynthesis/export family protein [Gemmataceae bacterium]
MDETVRLGSVASGAAVLRRRVRQVVHVVCLLFSVSCTAISDPLADGIPARLVPQDLLAVPKCRSQTIPLCALGQPEPDVYRLDTGDVLGVYIEGFLGERTQAPPVFVSPPVQLPDQNRLMPAAGYPVTVQEDGTIALPAVPPVSVRGLTVAEARNAIRSTYLKKELILADNDRLLVTLLHQRQVEVLVFRQEAMGLSASVDGPFPIAKRNSGRVVSLPGNQNDVLHALARSGGLPELDAYNEVIIFRNACVSPRLRQEIQGRLDAGKPEMPPGAADAVRRIPLRLPIGAPPPFRPEDVVLHQGDIIFLEARDEEVFFTAGLLPPGKHLLPRDQDLDVIEAISQVHGLLYNAAFGGSNLSGNILSPGIGNPSPSLLIVLRRCPGRGQVPIVVDLREALRHQQERLLVRPGDLLVLQEKPCEAMLRVVSQSMMNFNLFWLPVQTGNAVGMLNAGGPGMISQNPGSLFMPYTIGGR